MYLFYVGILWHFLVVNRLFLCASFCKFSLIRSPAYIVFINCLLPRMLCIPDHMVSRRFLAASEPDKTDHRPHHPPPEGGQGQQAPGSGQYLYRQNDGFDRFCTAKHSGFLRFSSRTRQHPRQLSLSVDMLQFPLCFSVHPESKRFSSYQDIQYSNRPPLVCVKVHFRDRNIFPFA